jgi:(S)-2-hydroxyglutarate dehydrogenase
MRKNFAIIGGGIVGLATAYRLGQRSPDAAVTVLEKEDAVGRHQTGNNSGVLHCGLYYKPGSVKARLAVNGIRQMVAFCQENGIAHEVCGKLVVAADREELPRLNELFDRGTRNGLEGLHKISREEMREIEPHVGGVAALRVPQEGIVDYHQVCAAIVNKIQAANGRVITGARVSKLRQTSRGWVAHTPKGDYEADFIINCAGLHCDRVSQMAGERRDLRIVPFRGEYYKISPERQFLVRNLIYPVPDPKFPFLGVHFTRLIHGGIEAGPNAVLAFAREGYHKSDINIGDLFDSLTYRGVWKFLAKYPKMCWQELRRSFSRELFCRSLQRLVPEIQPNDLATGGAGVRAQAIWPSGELVQDFHFVEHARALHVLNAPSPGATASLAIGEEIVNRIPTEI